MSRVLVVDDEDGVREMVRIALEGAGHQVVTAPDGAAARSILEREPAEVVVADIRLPDIDGIELLRFVRERLPDTEVILITAYASTATAIEALRLGAYDYITKPFDVEELKVTVEHAVERRSLRRQNVYLRRELSLRHRCGELVGRSPAMRRVFELIERVKDSATTVLISGESGTGKELVARAIHYQGPRGKAPFVTVNCAALPAQLLESELFGHVRGAFTGADRNKQGLFEAAGGGTLLLDEIGDLPLEMQPKLLRVLENRKVRPVGATKEVGVDVRVLAASNRDLGEAVREGRFREDLYYRINVIQIDLPPLRERPEDVGLLAEHFLERFAAEAGKGIEGFTEESKRLLESYSWPGNVRELENAVRRAVTLETSSLIRPEALPEAVRATAGSLLPAEFPAALPSGGVDLEGHLEQLKRVYILRALDQAGGVQKRAAELLGMSFRSFRYYVQKYGLRPRAAPGGAKGGPRV